MLDENDVVDLVCSCLVKRGFQIKQKLDASQQGIDIIAESSDKKFEYLIEAKGETSSRPGSERFEKPFNANQVHSHVAKGFYKGAELYSEYHSDKSKVIILAFPDTSHFRKYTGRIKSSLDSLGIRVLWVNEIGVMNEETFKPIDGGE